MHQKIPIRTLKSRCIIWRLVYVRIALFPIITRFFYQNVNAYRYVHNLFNPFVENAQKMNDCMDIFSKMEQQHTARVVLINFSLVNEVFDEESTIAEGTAISRGTQSLYDHYLKIVMEFI